KDKDKAGGAAQVVLQSYNKKVIDGGQWEVTTSLVNQGGAPASSISVTVHAVDADGKEVGSASGNATGNLEPGKQTTVVVTMTPNANAQEFRFDVGWQSITPVPSPKPGEAAKGEAGAQSAAPPAPTAAPTPKVTRYQAPPNTMIPPLAAPGNPTAQVPLTAPPSPPPGK
ncbi:MAG: YcfL family protein, partial [Thermoanaerobaculaceae bacterium]|nr:YcfL family protein [Thermoanaerobaculaceae bacterium]